jgi:hypothetical protein
MAEQSDWREKGGSVYRFSQQPMANCWTTCRVKDRIGSTLARSTPVTSLLYLDTARLGRMSLSAQRASRDFIGLLGELGASRNLDRILQHGLEACPSATRSRFPGLSEWKGVAALKEAVCGLVKLEPGLPALLAGRSAELMKFAAALLIRRCRNVMVVDLGWPGYHRVLSAECDRTHRRLTTVSLCAELLRGAIDENEVIRRIQAEFIKHECDGLLLPAVSHLGVRLPVQAIHREIEKHHEVRFVVVDGAQDFCHVTSDLRNDCCDLYLTGCHKWLGASQPMGLAFYGRRRSRAFIETVLARLIKSRQIDDPLLRFVELLCRGTTHPFEETVNISPLFSCQGAVSDFIACGQSEVDGPPKRIANAEHVADVAAVTGWIQRAPHPSLRSGILLLQAERKETRSRSRESLRAAFDECGVALTAYDDGLVRLSMPPEPITNEELHHLESAFQAIA